MSDFSVFMAGNVKENEIVKYVASKRFAAKGKPVEWEIKAVTSDVDEALRKECTKRVSMGKNGQHAPELDTNKYIGKLAVACTVYPNLNEVELQSSYGAMDGASLLKKMLLPGEYAMYCNKVMEVNGFEMGFDELVDEAKN